jgi:hypothetical protein
MAREVESVDGVRFGKTKFRRSENFLIVLKEMPDSASWFSHIPPVAGPAAPSNTGWKPNTVQRSLPKIEPPVMMVLL